MKFSGRIFKGIIVEQDFKQRSKFLKVLKTSNFN